MKERFFALFALLFVAVSVFSQNEVGTYHEQNGIMYLVTKMYTNGNEHGDVIVTHWDSLKTNGVVKYNSARKYEGIIVLPDNIILESGDSKNKYNIVGIDNHAFENCRNLIYVMIGQYTKFIGKRAFYNCAWLQVADLYSSLNNMVIGDEAYSKCEMLTIIDIKGNHKFGNNVFSGCNYIKKIYTRGINVNDKFSSSPINIFGNSTYTSTEIIHYGGDSPKEFYKRNDCWQEFRYVEFKKSSVTNPMSQNSNTNFQPTFLYKLTGVKFEGKGNTPVIRKFNSADMKDNGNTFLGLKERYRYQ